MSATRNCRARVFSKSGSSSARRRSSSPAICTSTSGTRTRKACRRSPRAAAGPSCTPRMRRRPRGCAAASSSAPHTRTKKPRRASAGETFCFPVLNPKSGWLYAFLYSMSAWLASASLEASDVIDLPTALSAAINAAIRDPLNGMWLITILAGFIFFTDTHVRSWRVLGGAFHATMHLAAAFIVGWAALLLTVQRLRSCVWQRRAAAGFGADHGAAGCRRRILHPRRLSIRVHPDFRAALERGFLVTADPGFQAMAAPAHRSRRESSRSMQSPSTACHGAGAPRSATAKARSRRTTRARRSRDSSTGLKCRPVIEARVDARRQRATEKRNQATGRLSRRMLSPSSVTR